MASISIYYEEKKIKILKDAANAEERTTSGYIQNILNNHIKSEHKKFKPLKPKKIKKLKRRKL